jgi:hypothetical protein
MLALHALAMVRIAQAQAPLSLQSGPIRPEAFMALSQRVTGHDDLSPALGGRILDVLSENGQTASLQALYAVVSDGTSEALADHHEILSRVLHGWYLGRISIDDQTYLTGFEETLMGRVTADILPLRSYCGGTMGFWAEPPAIGPLPLLEVVQ